MRMLSTCPCPLASNCFTWAALSQPQSCFGLSTRDDVSSLWLRSRGGGGGQFVGESRVSGPLLTIAAYFLRPLFAPGSDEGGAEFCLRGGGVQGGWVGGAVGGTPPPRRP